MKKAVRRPRGATHGRAAPAYERRAQFGALNVR
jgi:hypothetical protein